MGFSFFGMLLVISGPILGVIALVKATNLEESMRGLKREIDRLSKLLAENKISTAEVPLAGAASVPDVTNQTDVAPAEQALAAVEPVTAERAAATTVEKAEPESASEAQTVKAAKSSDVESALASRWLVWLGGLAIALGGLLLVKYAHDNGLIPPALRVVFGLLFAAALVAAGEMVRRQRGGVAKDYVPAALSAAGLVIAFGVIYAAYALYGLLSPAICFPGLVAVGLGALWLSRLQGPLIAALGLVGSYVAPVLVPSEHPSAWGFFLYLLVIVVAALYELRSRAWWWLGFAAVGGAFVWSMLWLHGGLFQVEQVIPVGLFALAMGGAAATVPAGLRILDSSMGTLAKPHEMSWPMRLAVTGLAASALILSGNVYEGQYGLVPLLIFGVGMVAITAFGWLRPGWVLAPLLAAALTLATLIFWPDVGFHELAFDDRGFWVTVPGTIAPPHFCMAMFVALGFFTLAGMFGSLKKVETLPWAILAASASVLFLFGTWARAEFVLSDPVWACLALGLIILVAFTADRIFGKQEKSAAALLAGGAVLGLFAIDRMFDGVWQTMAIAAEAAIVAFATRRWASPWLGALASAIGTLAGARLFVGREFWGEPDGLPLGRHWVIYGYGVPAALFWLSSRWLKGLGQARWIAALEGLSLGLGIALVSLELRVIIAGGITTNSMSLLELSAHALAWMGAAYGLAYRQSLYSSFISRWGAIVLLGASCLAFLGGLTVFNPVFSGDALEGGQLFNALWLAYFAPTVLLALVARKVEALGLPQLRSGLGIFALVLLVTFVTLLVMRQFQDANMVAWFESQAESYAVSLAWLITGICIFMGGLKLDRQNIRYGGLAILVLTVLKVFGSDLFALGGLWRIASMIGLGLCLVGVGWLYTRFSAVNKEKGKTA